MTATIIVTFRARIWNLFGLQKRRNYAAAWTAKRQPQYGMGAAYLFFFQGWRWRQWRWSSLYVFLFQVNRTTATPPLMTDNDENCVDLVVSICEQCYSDPNSFPPIIKPCWYSFLRKNWRFTLHAAILWTIFPHFYKYFCKVFKTGSRANTC